MTVARKAYVLLSLCCAAKSDDFAASTATCASPDCIADGGANTLELLQKTMEVTPHQVNTAEFLEMFKDEQKREGHGKEEGPSPKTVKELQPAAVQEHVGSNSSWPFLFERSISAQLEYELAPNTMPVKNKILLVIIEGLAFGMCGVDRCYMGQTCLGILKGVTFGGLGLWALIDYLIVMYNCLMSSPDVQLFGFNATFVDGSIKPAFWIALAFIVFKLIGKFGYWCSGSKGINDEPKPSCEANDESISKVVVS